MEDFVIAIDGPAGSGKSTVARGLADQLGLTYLNTGAMYRALALAASEAGVDPAEGAASGALAESLEIDFDGPRVLLADRDVSDRIGSGQVSEAASVISAHPEVRRALVARQQRIVCRGRWVAEGRDIGTVIAPDSPLKVYLGASAEERARRRAAELGEDYEAVLEELIRRDERDSSRAEGALKVAPDAVEVISTRVTAEEVIAMIVALARVRGLVGRT